MKKSSPGFFEHLVLDLLLKMGYGGSWTDAVTITQVRDFGGSLLPKKAKKGIFITTSSFPKSAEEYVAQIEHKIVLIDGRKLAELMIEYNIGVSPTKKVYEIKCIDDDYFEENE